MEWNFSYVSVFSIIIATLSYGVIPISATIYNATPIDAISEQAGVQGYAVADSSESALHHSLHNK